MWLRKLWKISKNAKAAESEKLKLKVSGGWTEKVQLEQRWQQLPQQGVAATVRCCCCFCCSVACCGAVRHLSAAAAGETDASLYKGNVQRSQQQQLEQQRGRGKRRGCLLGWGKAKAKPHANKLAARAKSALDGGNSSLSLSLSLSCSLSLRWEISWQLVRGGVAEERGQLKGRSRGRRVREAVQAAASGTGSKLGAATKAAFYVGLVEMWPRHTHSRSLSLSLALPLPLSLLSISLCSSPNTFFVSLLPLPFLFLHNDKTINRFSNVALSEAQAQVEAEQRRGHL